MKNLYVYNDEEVKKTGRTATRTVKGITGNIVTFTLVEICPVSDPTLWKKWVKEEDLYVIQDQ